MIVRRVNVNGGFTFIKDDAMTKALDRRKATQPACAKTSTCLAAVGRELHADYVVESSLTRKGNGYVLGVKITDEYDPGHPVETSEQMKQLSSLEKNVQGCVDLLMDAVGASQPAPKEPGKPQYHEDDPENEQ
jgi:hypothetical protein